MIYFTQKYLFFNIIFIFADALNLLTNINPTDYTMRVSNQNPTNSLNLRTYCTIFVLIQTRWGYSFK